MAYIPQMIFMLDDTIHSNSAFGVLVEAGKLLLLESWYFVVVCF